MTKLINETINTIKQFSPNTENLHTVFPFLQTMENILWKK